MTSYASSVMRLGGRAATVEAFERTTRDVSDLVRRHGAADRPIPHLTWTVSQCVAHLAISDWLYAHQFTGEAAAQVRIEHASALNDWSISSLRDARPVDLLDALESSTAGVVAAVSSVGDDATFPWWSGSHAPVTTGLALLVGERLVHGWDMARALRVPWTIDRNDAAIAMDGSISVMPAIVDAAAAAGLDAVLDFRLRGAGRYALRFNDGVLTTSRVDRSEAIVADCRISSDPVAALLVGTGRVSPWKEAARGRVIGWGRRPWLGLRLGRVLRFP